MCISGLHFAINKKNKSDLYVILNHKCLINLYI